jgi:hypothetical protein
MVGRSGNEPRLAVFLAAMDKVSQKLWMLHKRVDKNPSKRTLWPFSDKLIRVLLRIYHPILEFPCLGLSLPFSAKSFNHFTGHKPVPVLLFRASGGSYITLRLGGQARRQVLQRPNREIRA